MGSVDSPSLRERRARELRGVKDRDRAELVLTDIRMPLSPSTQAESRDEFSQSDPLDGDDHSLRYSTRNVFGCDFTDQAVAGCLPQASTLA